MALAETTRVLVNTAGLAAGSLEETELLRGPRRTGNALDSLSPGMWNAEVPGGKVDKPKENEACHQVPPAFLLGFHL